MRADDLGSRVRLPLGSAALSFVALFGVALPSTSHAGSGDGCVWDAQAAAPIGRIGAASALVDGKVYVFGGYFNQALRATSQVHVYDPATDAWTRLADMPLALTHAALAVDGQTVWIAGGFRGNEPGPVVADVLRYEVATDAWLGGPDLPAPRASGGAVRLGRELHYFGGLEGDRDTDASDHFVLDLDDLAGGWSVGPQMLTARNHLSAVELGGKAYAIGGQVGHDVDPLDVDLVHVFDPVTGLWTELAPLPFPRSHAESATFVSGGRIVVAGGRANTIASPVLADVTAYDPQTDTWSALPPLPAARLAPVAKAYGDRLFVSGGGTTANVPQADTFTRPQGATLGSELRMNAGGAPFLSSVSGEEWCVDIGSTGGQGYANTALTDIAGTDDDALYLTERSATDESPTFFGYRLPVDPGLYRVRLHFAEIYWGAPGGGPGGAGRRVFDVVLENQLVLRGLDINAEVGPATALVYMFDIPVTDRALNIELLSSVDRPKVSGIEISRLSDDAFENYCVSTPNSVGPGARIYFRGNISVADNYFHLSANGAPPFVNALFIQGENRLQAPLGNGVRCVGGAVYRLTPLASTDHVGWAEHTVDLSSPPQPSGQVFPGATWHYQLWYRDGQVSNLTDALTVTFLP